MITQCHCLKACAGCTLNQTLKTTTRMSPLSSCLHSTTSPSALANLPNIELNLHDFEGIVTASLKHLQGGNIIDLGDVIAAWCKLSVQHPDFDLQPSVSKFVELLNPSLVAAKFNSHEESSALAAVMHYLSHFKILLDMWNDLADISSRVFATGSSENATALRSIRIASRDYPELLSKLKTMSSHNKLNNSNQPRDAASILHSLSFLSPPPSTYHLALAEWCVSRSPGMKTADACLVVSALYQTKFASSDERVELLSRMLEHTVNRVVSEYMSGRIGLVEVVRTLRLLYSNDDAQRATGDNFPVLTNDLVNCLLSKESQSLSPEDVLSTLSAIGDVYGIRFQALGNDDISSYADIVGLIANWALSKCEVFLNATPGEYDRYLNSLARLQIRPDSDRSDHVVEITNIAASSEYSASTVSSLCELSLPIPESLWRSFDKTNDIRELHSLSTNPIDFHLPIIHSLSSIDFSNISSSDQIRLACVSTAILPYLNELPFDALRGISAALPRSIKESGHVTLFQSGVEETVREVCKGISVVAREVRVYPYRVDIVMR